MGKKRKAVKTSRLEDCIAVVLLLAIMVLCIWGIIGPFKSLLTGSGVPEKESQGASVSAAVEQRFSMYMNNRISDAMEGVLAIERQYWLSDDDLVAPKPNPANYGTCSSAMELMPILAQAEELLEGQTLYFNENTTIYPGTVIRYYLDETILVITWKQAREGAVYTFSEIKIAHPSQLRRFLSGGSYGSGIQLTTTEMAQSVNAVLASSGDFYGFRRAGVVCYDGVVYRADRLAEVDTCFIDNQGELIFSYAGSFKTKEDAQKFVDDNNIRFSLAFGPILVDGGKNVDFGKYLLGDVDLFATRAVLGQRDKLHYVIVVCNVEGNNWYLPKMAAFQSRITDIGCDRVYALDGGQTAVIAMDGKLINAVHFGTQRDITDIFYFATAIPEGKK